MILEGKGLAEINSKFKDMATGMAKESQKPFYNVSKSEQFNFLPHTGIGMLRINRIADHIRKLAKSDDNALVEKVVEERIAKIPQDKRVVTFKTLGVFDPKVRKPQDSSCTGYLKEYVLGTNK